MANLQLAKNLRKYRKARGYTQDKLGKYLNISRQAYSNYERANRDPAIGLLIRLCELYNVSMVLATGGGEHRRTVASHVSA